MTRVFVYGTLKRGGSNHHCLAGQQFLGAGRTPPGFTLYALADYPGMVREPKDDAGVTGEVWAVDPACLETLDRLEGVMYVRALYLVCFDYRRSLESGSQPSGGEGWWFGIDPGHLRSTAAATRSVLR